MLSIGCRYHHHTVRDARMRAGRLCLLATATLIASLFFGSTAAQDDDLGRTGAACNASNSVLLVASNQLMTDCGYLAWCDPSSSKCVPRGCRKDEYPFGYSTVDRSKWPPACGSGKFCPDEGSTCMDKINLGGACQLNRDDECATSSQHPQVRCLHNTCVAVNATLNTACIHENVVYTTFTPDNSSYGAIVSRDNCGTGLYCDSVSDVCLARKEKLATCSADKECLTDFCLDNGYTAQTPDNNDASGTCAEQPYVTVRRHRVWVYVVVVLLAFVPMLLLIVALLKLHQRQGAKRRSALQAYWDTQRAIQEKVQIFKEDLRSYAGSGHAASYSSQAKLLGKPGPFADSREKLLDGGQTPATPTRTPWTSSDVANSPSRSRLRHSVAYEDDVLISSPHLVRHHGEFNDGSGGADDSDYHEGSSSRPLSMQADSHWRRSQIGSTGNIAGMFDGTLRNQQSNGDGSSTNEHEAADGHHVYHADARGSLNPYVDAFHTPQGSHLDLMNDGSSMEHLEGVYSTSQNSLPLSAYESVNGLSSTQGHGSPSQRVQHLAAPPSNGLRNREGTAQSSRMARQTGEGPSSPEARRESQIGDWSFFASEGHGTAGRR